MKNNILKKVFMRYNNMNDIKISLLGVCNSKNTLVEAEKKGGIINEPYVFQPCFLDITKEGLDIPYKDFYKTPSIDGKNETAIFTKKTMQFDLNKRALSTIESINPNILMIDISSLTMRTYEVTYNNKKVFSVNAYSPLCYEFLQQSVDFEFEKINVTESMAFEALEEFSRYLKNSWDINKVLLFRYKRPKFYVGLDKKIYEYPSSYWGVKQAETIENYNKYFLGLLPDLRVYEDTDVKLGFHAAGELEKKEPIPSIFHTSEESKKLQGLSFRSYLLNEDNSEEIDAIKSKLLKDIETKVYHT